MSQLKDMVIEKTEEMMKADNVPYTRSNWEHYYGLAVDQLTLTQAKKDGKETGYCHECGTERPIKIVHNDKCCEFCGWEI